MQTIVCNKKKYTVPAGWNDVSRKQLLKIMAVMHSRMESSKALFQIAGILSGANFLTFNLYPAEVLHHLYNLAENMVEENTLTQQKLPHIRYYFTRLYGPISEFDNLILLEFHHTEMAYHNYVHTRQIEYLQELAAVLYRSQKQKYDIRRNADGDVRVPFKQGEVAYHLSIITKMPNPVLWAIAHWYDGCRQALIKSNPTVYPQTAKTQNASQVFEGLYKLMRGLAGNKFGPFEQVQNMNVHTAHLEMGILIEEQAKIDAEIAALKNRE